MGTHYELIKNLDIEYTWDRGPRPSGYAQVKARLMPMEEGDDLILLPTNKFWEIKAPSYISIEEKKRYEESIETTYLPMVSSGIYEAVVFILAEILDFPIENAVLKVEKITIDLVFSARKSFEFAVKEALTVSIKQAYALGYLRLVN